MKITCPCGALVSDSGDALPHKAHLIADQQWFATLEGIDLVMDDVAAGRANAERGAMTIRGILGGVARCIYQCRQCGRVFIDHHQRQKLHEFTPAAAETSREILKGGASDHR